MTDTRKEFEQWHQENDWADCLVAESAWQACQQLNDRKIADLLAVIAKKDEALQVIVKETHHDLWQGELAKQAFSIQPSDVELVEVGRWVDEGNEDESDFYPISYCGREGSGDMCYTIKEKDIS